MVVVSLLVEETDKQYHINLYRVHITVNGVRTHNVSDEWQFILQTQK